MNAIIKEKNNQIVEFDEFELKLQEFRKRYNDVVYDLSIFGQDKQARSDKYAIGKIISSLDSRHKELKAPYKEKCDQIDSLRKNLKDEFLSIQGKIKSQIDTHEAEIQAHIDKLQVMVDDINNYAIFDEHSKVDSDAVMKNIKSLNLFDIDEHYENRQADATLAKVKVLKTLEFMFDVCIKKEQEQAELETLRKEKEKRDRVDREEKIRKEAAEKATMEAEAASKKAIDEANKREQDVIKKAKQQKEDADLAKEIAKQKEVKAKKDAADQIEFAANAEREKIKREQELKSEQERIQKEKDDVNKSKQTHRKKIHEDTKKSFIDNGFDNNEATRIVVLIKEGKIKNVTIIY